MRARGVWLHGCVVYGECSWLSQSCACTPLARMLCAPLLADDDVESRAFGRGDDSGYGTFDLE